MWRKLPIMWRQLSIRTKKATLIQKNRGSRCSFAQKSDIDWKKPVVRLYKKRAKKIEEMLESENKIVERF